MGDPGQKTESHCFLRVCFFKSIGRYDSNDDGVFETVETHKKQHTQKNTLEQYAISEPEKLMN